jgi:hypothetical protein
LELEKAKDEVEKQNQNSGIFTVNMIIWSPNVHNSIITDLPGLFYSQSIEEDDLSKSFKQMTINYLNLPNNIPIVVHSAPADPATNQGLHLVNKNNKTEDALGVISGLDMLKGKTIF